MSVEFVAHNHHAANQKQGDKTTDSVRQYMDRIAKTARLDAAEEVQLAKDIEVGLYAAQLLQHESFGSEQEMADLQNLRLTGEMSKRAFVEANLSMVVPIAMRYRGKGVPLWDLIQEGNMGIIKAVEGFDYMQGYKFSTYATPKIYEKIIRSFYDQGRSNPLSRAYGEQVSKLNRIFGELEEQFCRKPTIEELSQEMELPTEKIQELLYLNTEPISIDRRVGEFDPQPLGHLIADSDNVGTEKTAELQSLRDQLDSMFLCMKEEDEAMLRSSAGYGTTRKSNQQIGEELGISKNAVERRKGILVKNLRGKSYVAHLVDFLR